MYLNIDSVLVADGLFKAMLFRVFFNPPLSGSGSAITRSQKAKAEVDKVLDIQKSVSEHKLKCIIRHFPTYKRVNIIIVSNLGWPALQVIKQLLPGFAGYEVQSDQLSVQRLREQACPSSVRSVFN